MAQGGIQLDQEKLCCSICLDLLTDPVTIPCGHSYCIKCIKCFWDEKDMFESHSCPQCRQTFRPRPVLVKNTMLADLVEEVKKSGLRADHCYAGPGDVACDFCTRRKLKAVKSCLQCLVSYCEQHLQPHYDSPAFEKHKLVDVSKKIENICSHHGEAMTIFCRTDRQRICSLCSKYQHRYHDFVLAEDERAEKQKELDVSRQKIQQRIRDREKDVKQLQQEVEAINGSADKAVRDNDKIFTELIRLIEQRSSELKQQIRSQQESEVGRAREYQKNLQQEVTRLRREDAELEELSNTLRHSQFFQKFTSPSQISECTDSPSLSVRPLSYFEDVTAAVSEARDKFCNIFHELWPEISVTVTEVDVLLPPEDPKTRTGFLRYAQQITMDPNTANTLLILSDGNRKAKAMEISLLTAVQFLCARQPESHAFTDKVQVLSREPLTGRCYWEVECSGGVSVAVAYKGINRTSSESEFGLNAKSWALLCVNDSYEFRHNKRKTFVPPGPQSSRVGVYLDYRAGVVSFYSVSETMTLLHRVHTTFTQPLYAGLWLDFKSKAELCDLK